MNNGQAVADTIQTMTGDAVWSAVSSMWDSPDFLKFGFAAGISLLGLIVGGMIAGKNHRLHGAIWAFATLLAVCFYSFTDSLVVNLKHIPWTATIIASLAMMILAKLVGIIPRLGDIVGKFILVFGFSVVALYVAKSIGLAEQMPDIKFDKESIKSLLIVVGLAIMLALLLAGLVLLIRRRYSLQKITLIAIAAISLVFIALIVASQMSWFGVKDKTIQSVLSLLILGSAALGMTKIIGRQEWNKHPHLITEDGNTEGDYHWFGIIGCALVHIDIFILLWWSSSMIASFWAWLALPFCWVLSATYIVDVRFMLIVRVFDKPLHCEVEHGASFDLKAEEAKCKKRCWSHWLFFGAYKLINGLRPTLTPAWLFFIKVDAMAYEKIEINGGPDKDGVLSPELPTLPMEMPTKLKEDMADLGFDAEAYQKLSWLFKISGKRYLAEPFIKMAAEDRATDENYQAFLIRHAISALAKLTRAITMTEGLKYGFPEADELTPTPKLVVARDENGRRPKETFKVAGDLGKPRFFQRLRHGANWQYFHQYLAQELREEAGFLMTEFELLDVNPPKDVEKAMEAVKIAQMEIQTALLAKEKAIIDAQAAGAAITEPVEAIVAKAMVAPDVALAAFTLISATEGENQVFFPTSIMDAASKAFAGSKIVKAA